MVKRWFNASTIESEEPSLNGLAHKQAVLFPGLLSAQLPSPSGLAWVRGKVKVFLLIVKKLRSVEQLRRKITGVEGECPHKFPSFRRKMV